MVSSVLANSNMFQDETLSLLQLKATKLSFNHTDGAETVRCEAQGDTHVNSWINGVHNINSNPQGPGMYPLMTKKDGTEAVQFYQCACPVSASEHSCSFMNSLAFKFGDVKVRIHPDMDNTNAPMLVCIGDEPVFSPDVWDNSPKTREGFCQIMENRLGVIPGTEGPDQVVLSGRGITHFELRKESTGLLVEGYVALMKGYTAPDGRGRTGYVMNVDITMTDVMTDGTLDICFTDPVKWGTDWLDVNNNAITYADFGEWSAEDDPSTAFVESSLFTKSDHDMFCNKCNWQGASVAACDTTVPFKEPLPDTEQSCITHNCPFSMGQQLCKSLKSHQEDYDECLYDFCQTCDEGMALDWEQWESIKHPEPACADGMDVCKPADICSKSTTMNMLNVMQNNLGGAGPDSGAEEIRFGKAASINGQSVDLVITTDGQYKSKKASRNGVPSGSFGNINVQCGSEVTLVFSVVNSETGDPVLVDDIAISWYDIDEGKKATGRSSVTGCGDGMVTDSNSELTRAHVGSCWVATSSTKGTAADNPTNPFMLTPQQRARVATFPYTGVSSFTSTLKVDKGWGGRNFNFALEPAVACKGGE